MVLAQEMLIERVCVTLQPVAALLLAISKSALMAKLKLPLTSGVPVIAPVLEFSANPAGKAVPLASVY